MNCLDSSDFDTIIKFTGGDIGNKGSIGDNDKKTCGFNIRDLVKLELNSQTRPLLKMNLNSLCLNLTTMVNAIVGMAMMLPNIERLLKNLANWKMPNVR